MDGEGVRTGGSTNEWVEWEGLTTLSCSGKEEEDYHIKLLSQCHV
jgi:hypothetical protein